MRMIWSKTVAFPYYTDLRGSGAHESSAISFWHKYYPIYPFELFFNHTLRISNTQLKPPFSERGNSLLHQSLKLLNESLHSISCPFDLCHLRCPNSGDGHQGVKQHLTYLEWRVQQGNLLVQHPDELWWTELSSLPYKGRVSTHISL